MLNGRGGVDYEAFTNHPTIMEFLLLTQEHSTVSSCITKLFRVTQNASFRVHIKPYNIILAYSTEKTLLSVFMKKFIVFPYSF